MGRRGESGAAPHLRRSEGDGRGRVPARAPFAIASGAMAEIPAGGAAQRRDTLYLQVLAGIALGILVGYAWPEEAQALRPLGEVFVRMIKMLIALIEHTREPGAAAGRD